MLLAELPNSCGKYRIGTPVHPWEPSKSDAVRGHLSAFGFQTQTACYRNHGIKVWLGREFVCLVRKGFNRGIDNTFNIIFFSGGLAVTLSNRPRAGAKGYTQTLISLQNH
jgi:hypothetical protein